MYIQTAFLPEITMAGRYLLLEKHKTFFKFGNMIKVSGRNYQTKENLR